MGITLAQGALLANDIVLSGVYDTIVLEDPVLCLMVRQREQLTGRFLSKPGAGRGTPVTR